MSEFVQPLTLDGAIEFLRDRPDTRLLAGGTDLIVQMRDRAVKCGCLMDVKRIPELSVFAYAGEWLEIGGAVTCNQILEADFLEEGHLVLKQAAAALANSLLRNRATLAGNICNASPGGDMIPACLVLDGRVVTVSPSGGREILLRDFFTGVKKHVLAPDEIVVKVLLSRKKGRGIYLKKRRIRGHDLAQVGVCGFYGAHGALSMAFAAVGPTPVLLDSLGAYNPEQLRAEKERIVALCGEAVSPISDVRSSKEYRDAMLRYFAGKIIDAFADGTEAEL